MTLLVLFLAYAIILSVGLWRAGVRPSTRDVHLAPGPSPTRVLIVGATGGTGRMLVDQALERGYVVTALVRNPAGLQRQHPNLRPMTGNVLDRASLDAAVRGQDAVLSALGHKRYVGPTRILSDGTRNLMDAMKSHGVRRFICETSLGIGNTAGRMGLYYTLFVIPVVLPFYFWDKARQERFIAASGLDWIIVRPGALTDGVKRGRYRQGPDVGSLLWTVRISRADVADFMLNQLTDNSLVGTAPVVAW